MNKKLSWSLLLIPSILFCLDWTVMVYMCADNSMNEQSYADLEEMTQVGSTDRVKIVVQVDNLSTAIEPGCRRYLINHNNRELISNLGTVDMANPQTLIDFVRFATSTFPAQKYMLILWDHANGWPIGTYCHYQDKAIIYDQSSNNWIGIADGELRYALNQIRSQLGRKLSIIGFDACLMAMAEVADEVANGADIMFASEELTPWDGLPYHDIFNYLVANPGISALNLAKNMVFLARNSYQNGSQGNENCTYSATDLARYVQARSNLAASVNILNQVAYTQSMRDIRNRVQTFSIEHTPATSQDDYIDLIHFLSLCLHITTNRSDSVQIANTITSLKSSVIEHQRNGSNLENAQGISVWFPDNYLTLKSNFQDYQNLVWSQKTGWLKLLNNYFSTDDIKPTPVSISASDIGRKNDFTLNWTQSKDLSRVYYNLKEVKTYEQKFVDACSDFTNWTNNGFTISSAQAHSASKSFYSDSGNSINHTLNLTNPVLLPSGGLLTFWAYYETEERYAGNYAPKRDLFYIETADASHNYTIIDSFYGSRREWKEHRYLIAAQESIFIRFRYTTDASNSRLGVYIDDIGVLSFNGIRDIAANLNDTSFYFFNLAQHTYHYLVTPVDSFGNVGFTSGFGTVNVQNYGEPYSMPSPFFTDCRIICDYPSASPPEYSLKLFIYTLNGELVKQFDDTQFNQNTVYWDGCNQAGQEVASGLYIVVLKTGNFTRIGKIAKVR